MKTLDELKSEYLRSALFGTSSKRRMINIILEDIKTGYGSELDASIEELQTTIANLKKLATDALEMVEKQLPKSSLEFENLRLKAKEVGGNEGYQYIAGVINGTTDPNVSPRQ